MIPIHGSIYLMAREIDPTLIIAMQNGLEGLVVPTRKVYRTISCIEPSLFPGQPKPADASTSL